MLGARDIAQKGLVCALRSSQLAGMDANIEGTHLHLLVIPLCLISAWFLPPNTPLESSKYPMLRCQPT